jgi:hypothetical protein
MKQNDESVCSYELMNFQHPALCKKELSSFERTQTPESLLAFSFLQLQTATLATDADPKLGPAGCLIDWQNFKPILSEHWVSQRMGSRILRVYGGVTHGYF